MTNHCAFILSLLTSCLMTTCTHLHEQEAPPEYKLPAKFDSPAKYVEVFADMREPAEGHDRYTSHYQYRALEKARTAGRSIADPLPWQERGPGNVSGRTRSVIFDPADSTLQSWYAGSVGGGVWRTENAGDTWVHLTEGLPQLAIGAMAISPANPDVIYAATGEGLLSLPSIDGMGVWKSVDRGASWAPIMSTLEDERFVSTTRMVVDPEDENHLLISIIDNRSTFASYILRSQDGGGTWEEVLRSPGSFIRGVIQQVFTSRDFDVWYAAINAGGLVSSSDQGETWDTLYAALPGQARIEGAIYPQNPEVIYLAIEDESGVATAGSSLLQTLDGGETWQLVQGPNGPLRNWLGGQGWYDNTIAVHPSDSTRVYVGGQLVVLEVEVDSLVETIQDQLVVDRSDVVDVADLSSFFTPFDGFTITESIANSIGLTTGIVEEDLVPLTINLITDTTFLLHRFSSFFAQDSFPIFLDSTFAGIQVLNAKTGEQLAVGFSDENGNGMWDINPLEDGSVMDLFALEPIFVYDHLATDTVSQSIAQDLFDRNMYTIFFVSGRGGTLRPADYQGNVAIQFLDIQVSRGSEEVTAASFKGVHVDHHNIQLRELDGDLYILNGNDGGVSFSSDGGATFKQTGDLFGRGAASDQFSFGYNTSQFYGLDKMNGEDRYIGGTQDNGTWFSLENPDKSSPWMKAPSGDGFEAIWNYANPDWMIESFQNNGIFLSQDRGVNWARVTLPDGAGSGPFVTQLAGSQVDANLIYGYAENGVIRSTDFGQSWTLVSMPPEWVYDGGYAPIEISQADPNIIWTGSRMRSDNGLVISVNGGTEFRATALYDGPTSAITGIATHPFDPATAYILFGGPGTTKILKTNDLGASWTDLSGFEEGRVNESSNGFPDVIAYSLLVMPFDTNRLWAGTEIGLFESMDGGASWQIADNGLPNTAVWDMKVVNDEVVVATHGRGIWSVPFEELSDYVPVAAILAPAIEAHSYSTFDGTIDLVADLRSAYDSSAIQLILSDSVVGSIQVPGNSSPRLDTARLAVLDFITDDTIQNVELEVVGFVGDRAVVGSRVVREVYLIDNDIVDVAFVDSLNVARPGNFARDGFVIAQEPGFSTAALQSQHPHDQLTDLFAIFQKPILVNEATNRVQYDQILIIEPGDSPDINNPDFYDYGGIEASSDFGNSWTLLSGNDATADDRWLEIYDAGGAPDSDDLYVTNDVSLLDFFEIGDTVLIRFRLFSDPFVVGWGMAVDNLIIGDPSTSSSNYDLIADISTYPNPFTDEIHVRVEGVIGQYDVSLFSISGREMIRSTGRENYLVTLTTEAVPAGTYILRVTQGTQQQSTLLLKL